MMLIIALVAAFIGTFALGIIGTIIGFVLGLIGGFYLLDPKFHPERHIIVNDKCPYCGTTLAFNTSYRSVKCSDCEHRSVIRNSKLFTPEQAKALAK